MLNKLLSPTNWLESMSWTSVFSGKLAVVTLLIVFMLLSTLESRFPTKTFPKKAVLQSYKTNISLFIFNSTLMSLVSVPYLRILAQQNNGQGLLRYIPNSAGQAIHPVVYLARFAALCLAQRQPPFWLLVDVP